VTPLGIALVGLLLIGKYDELQTALRHVLIGFLGFGAAAVLARPDWARLAAGSLLPALSLGHDAVAGALALVGTTLTAYVYMWETVERGVEQRGDAGTDATKLAAARWGAIVGAGFTALVFWSMLAAAASTLGRSHRAVMTAGDAARALRPLAGGAAQDLFAAGLVVSAVVALPVLMASTAYAVGAQFDWRRGLSQPVRNATGFYGVLGAPIALAMVVALARVSVVDMLVAASVLGGIGTPVGLVLLVRLARDPEVVGDAPISRRLAAGGWAVAVIVTGFGLAYLVGGALGA